MDGDFIYKEDIGWIEKNGYYSRCVPHEATREEALLWHRVQELEVILEKNRPPEAQALVAALRALPESTPRVAMNAEDFCTLRSQAADVVDMVVHPHELVRQGILGAFDRWEDGFLVRTWIMVKRDVPLGVIQVVVPS